MFLSYKQVNIPQAKQFDISLWYNMYTEYKSNRNVVYSCKYHIVFCPKYRRPVLVEGVDIRLKELISETCERLRISVPRQEQVVKTIQACITGHSID